MSIYVKNMSLSSYLLFVGAIVLITLGILGAIWGKTESVEAVKIQEITSQHLNLQPNLMADKQQTTGENKFPKSLDNPDQLIEHYQKQLEQHPGDPNTPAYLLAMGNLYKLKKMDCAKAIPYYERVIIEYPDWEGIKSVYPELAACYEEVNDYQGKVWIHGEIMKRFPEDSQEYLFAKESLGLSSPSE